MRLNHRIAIQQRTTLPDEIGQPVDTWATIRSCWSDIRYLSGIETIKADTDTSIVKASIRIRKSSVSIDSGMRVVHGSVIFDIEAVLPDDRNEFINLVCKAV